MEGTLLSVEGAKPQKRVRFRVASGSSGRVLKEMFKDDGPSDSLDSDCTSSSEVERASTPSTNGEPNGHIAVYLGSELDDSESEPDDLLLYAGAKDKDRVFSTKRVNILSKNGTVRGVKHKVSAGQIVFDNMTKVTEVSNLNTKIERMLYSRVDDPKVLTEPPEYFISQTLLAFLTPV